MHRKLHAVGPLAANYQACSIVFVRMPADSPLRNALEKWAQRVKELRAILMFRMGDN